MCNAHHLRELTYVFEEMGQTWANRLIDLLVAACQEVNQAGGVLTTARLAFYRTEYDAILSAGAAANPRAPPSGKRGRTRQSKALNLIDRLRDHADDVWRFATDHHIPFSNNVAEQAVRMPKVKQKVSGGFRTKAGLDTFCTIRSYLATLHKQGTTLFFALTQAFQGSVPSLASLDPAIIITSDYLSSYLSSSQNHVHCGGNRNTHSDTCGNFQSGVAHALAQGLMIRCPSCQLVDGHGMLAHLPAQAICIQHHNKRQRNGHTESRVSNTLLEGNERSHATDDRAVVAGQPTVADEAERELLGLDAVDDEL